MPDAATIRVLLVGDHQTLREGLRLIVNNQPDMQVVGEAGGGRTALEAVTNTQPDVVVLDLSMPAGGLSTARALHGAAKVGLVVLTQYDDRASVQDLTAAGAEGYVLKQSPSTELLRAIRAVASGGRYLDAALPQSEPDGEARRIAKAPSDREHEVLRLIALGHSNKEVGVQLNISIKTVEVHKANAMRKLNLRGRSDLVRYAVLKEWLRDG